MFGVRCFYGEHAWLSMPATTHCPALRELSMLARMASCCSYMEMKHAAYSRGPELRGDG